MDFTTAFVVLVLVLCIGLLFLLVVIWDTWRNPNLHVPYDDASDEFFENGRMK